MHAAAELALIAQIKYPSMHPAVDPSVIGAHAVHTFTDQPSSSRLPIGTGVV